MPVIRAMESTQRTAGLLKGSNGGRVGGRELDNWLAVERSLRNSKHESSQRTKSLRFGIMSHAYTPSKTLSLSHTFHRRAQHSFS